MTKLNNLSKKRANTAPTSNTESLLNHDLIKKSNLKDCREVEEEFIKEFKLLEQHMANPDFGLGPNTIGSELEIALINKYNLMPSMVNIDICDYLQVSSFQPEISKFCLEYNGPVISLSNNPFNTLENEIQLGLSRIKAAANNNFDTDLATIGIMPTLTIKDLGMDALTPYWRYHSLDKLLRSLRCNSDFVIDIGGEDPLHIKWYNTVLEGVNSSYQVHLRVNPDDFNDSYNAAQLASSFVLSLCGNSPLLFGSKLWEETRIAIFEQTVNNYNIHPGSWQEQNRVSFGRGWIKDGALGLLKEVCDLFYPIFPIVPDQNTTNNSEQQLNSGPILTHIKQHNSSVWPWNRPVYDNADGGHFRIEMRYLPSGPTVYDMVSNTAFMLGLTKYFSNNINSIIKNMPFKYAQYNFYQAAQHGLDADCIWPSGNSSSLKETKITCLLPDIIKMAAEGLNELGVSSAEIQNMQNTISYRLQQKLTGAVWQKTIFNKYIAENNLSTDTALQSMFRLYIKNQNTNMPVASWSLDI